MLRSVVGLPFRLGARWAGLAARGTGEVAERALGLAGLVSHVVSGVRQPDVDLDGSPHEPPAPSAKTPPPAPPPPPAETPPPRPAETPPPPVASPPPLPDMPLHVSEEATLVDSVAEAGAEDGAGAQIRVDEPWEGYRQMKADDVIDRLIGASTAALATVELFERAGRGRQSILAAVTRELKRAGGAG